MQQSLIIKGARVHNLKNISLEIPRNQLVVFTGLSGSGKSSLAFDTIYAEGQRRYVESMSSYARQFLGQMEKPDVDAIEGLSPAISIDQKTTAHNPRSTVGTVTEIHDYLRLLYARVGIPHCPSCGKEIRQQTVDEMVSALMALPEDTKLMLMAPIVRNRKGEHAKLLEEARKDGFVRARIDGEIYDLDETPTLDKQKKHTIEIVVDRVSIRENLESRLTDSLETVLRRSGGIATVKIVDGDDMMFSQNYSCPDCGINIEELAPRMFSFNNPYGACPACNGLGKFLSVTPDLVFPDTTKSLNQGAITAMGWNSAGDSRSTSHMLFKGLSDYYKFSMDTPINQLPQKVVDMLLYGSGGTKIPITFESINGQGTYKITYEGIIPSMRRRYSETTSDSMKAAYEEYMREEVCSVCHGLRLKPEALAVTLGDMNIADYSNLNLVRAREFISHLSLSETKTMIAEGIIREINARLGFLCNVGLDYLTLSRAAASLSGAKRSASALPHR